MTEPTKVTAEWRHESGGMTRVTDVHFDGFTEELVSASGRVFSPRRRVFGDEACRGCPSGLMDWILAWHRAAYLGTPDKPGPILADECYPPGELPRKMAENEVRHPDGSVSRMIWWDNEVCIGGSFRWTPSMVVLDYGTHPTRVPGQLARLQAFWDRHAPLADNECRDNGVRRPMLPNEIRMPDGSAGEMRLWSQVEGGGDGWVGIYQNNTLVCAYQPSASNYAWLAVGNVAHPCANESQRARAQAFLKEKSHGGDSHGSVEAKLDSMRSADSPLEVRSADHHPDPGSGERELQTVPETTPESLATPKDELPEDGKGALPKPSYIPDSAPFCWVTDGLGRQVGAWAVADKHDGVAIAVHSDESSYPFMWSPYLESIRLAETRGAVTDQCRALYDRCVVDDDGAVFELGWTYPATVALRTPVGGQILFGTTESDLKGALSLTRITAPDQVAKVRVFIEQAKGAEPDTVIRDDSATDAWKRLVVEQMAAGALSWRWHGIGVLQAYLKEGGDEEIRVHVWSPRLVLSGILESGNAHNHRFALDSSVLVGRLQHTEWHLTPEAGGDFETFDFVHARLHTDENRADMRATGNRFSVRKTEHIIAAGQAYTFKRGAFHDSAPLDGIVVTVCTKRDQIEEKAMVVAPRALPPVPAFSGDLDETLKADVLDAAFRALGGVPTEADEQSSSVGSSGDAEPDDEEETRDCDPFGEEFGDIEVMRVGVGEKSYNVHLGAGVSLPFTKKDQADGCAALILAVRDETARALTEKVRQLEAEAERYRARPMDEPEPPLPVGDGVSDDTAAIQALADKGKPIPTGTYLVTGPPSEPEPPFAGMGPWEDSETENGDPCKVIGLGPVWLVCNEDGGAFQLEQRWFEGSSQKFLTDLTRALVGVVPLEDYAKAIPLHEIHAWPAKLESERDTALARAEKVEARAQHLYDLCGEWAKASDCITSNEHTPEALQRYGERLQTSRDEMQAGMFEAEKRARELETQLASVTAQRDRAETRVLELETLRKDLTAVVAQHRGIESRICDRVAALLNETDLEPKDRRPSCIPDGVTEWTRLPSGLACWKVGGVCRIEDHGNTNGSGLGFWSLRKDCDYESCDALFTDAVPHADFHAARVFMGWEQANGSAKAVVYNG